MRPLWTAPSGDRAAFSELVREHGSAVLGFLLRRTRDPALAEDLTQETFLHAWRGRKGFRGETSVRGWLLAIATNVMRDHMRARKRRPVEEAPGEDSVSYAADPAERVTHAEALDRLRVALAGLPENHREMFLLRERDGLSYKEIAALLECPIGSVMSGLARARERLLQAVDG